MDRKLLLKPVLRVQKLEVAVAYFNRPKMFGLNKQKYLDIM